MSLSLLFIRGGLDENSLNVLEENNEGCHLAENLMVLSNLVEIAETAVVE
jgi:hypothetical protein